MGAARDTRTQGAKLNHILDHQSMVTIGNERFLRILKCKYLGPHLDIQQKE